MNKDKQLEIYGLLAAVGSQVLLQLPLDRKRVFIERIINMLVVNNKDCNLTVDDVLQFLDKTTTAVQEEKSKFVTVKKGNSDGTVH